jgi:hypothetical protein
MILAEIQEKVHYNQSTRKWLCTLAEFEREFPAGNAGKRQAQMCYLAQTAPEVHAELRSILRNTEAAADCLGIYNRAVDAALLVAGHSVWADEIAAVARVESQAKPGRSYHLYPDPFAPPHLACQCDDHSFRAPWLPGGQRACKHILAYLLVQYINEREEAFYGNR